MKKFGPDGYPVDVHFNGGSAPNAPPSYDQCVGGGGQQSQGWADQQPPYPTNSGAPPYYGGGQPAAAQVQQPYPTGAAYYGMHTQQGMAPYPQQPQQQQQQQPQVVYLQNVEAGQFDAGARFTNYAPMSIPPPPPGYAPNASQVAAAQGAHVVPSQKKGGFLNGTGSGGFTFW